MAAIGFGVLFAIAATNLGGTEWVFVALMAAAVIAALAQQTLP